ncbi:MAG: toll/interleukin-1 receptor domain-containing protein, partial [Bryobacteraceae bacterium]
NSRDVEPVTAIAQALRQRGVNAWFDEWNVPPGASFMEEIERALGRTRSVAIFIGSDGLGPWEQREMRIALQLLVKRNSPVIPVLLPDAPAKPELPLFLEEFSQVRFPSIGDDAAVDKLVWGINNDRSSNAIVHAEVPNRA